jgi:uncharacterized protein with NRDE domain
MCLIAWNWQPDSPTPLLVLSNRDEYYARPTRTLRQWPMADHGAKIWAGQDMQAGGTWLGINAKGRFAGVTNYRSGEQQRSDATSRGELVASFLQSSLDAKDYLNALSIQAHNYNPFNLVVFDGDQLMGFESHHARTLTMKHGIGAVSNAEFDTPWPKLTRIKNKLKEQVDFNTTDTNSLVHLLHDTDTASHHELPSTGIPYAVERALSATFIKTQGYGTRACSVVRLHHTNTEFYEELFDETGLIGTSSCQFFL